MKWRWGKEGGLAVFKLDQLLHDPIAGGEAVQHVSM